MASAQVRPLYSPELTSTPSSEMNGSLFRAFESLQRLNHLSNFDPYFVANSKSRSSCAGTLMMAPVP